jgi:hypothetical protein
MCARTQYILGANIILDNKIIEQVRTFRMQFIKDMTERAASAEN